MGSAGRRSRGPGPPAGAPAAPCRGPPRRPTGRRWHRLRVLMDGAPPRYLLPLVMAGVGALLLYRAVTGGGPVAYFGSAVFFGMALAALQAGRRPPRG